MTNKTWIGAALFVLVLAGALIATTLVIRRGDDKSANAQEVIDRATQAQTAFLDSVKPDSTVHIVIQEYDPGKVNVDRGPGWNPVNAQRDWWSYFDPNGTLIEMRIETSDMDTGEVIRVVEYIEGALTTTYSLFDESGSVPMTMTIDRLREQLAAATNASLDTLAVDAGAAVATQQVDGEAAYVLEEATSRSVQRIFIDLDSYLPVKVEVERDGELVGSTAVPVYEFTEGNSMPDAMSDAPKDLCSLATIRCTGY
jgi:hypothetical protein